MTPELPAMSDRRAPEAFPSITSTVAVASWAGDLKGGGTA